VREKLEERLRSMTADGQLPDVLTFAGNGEPTCHPDFAGIVDDTLCLRDAWCPKAKVSVLSNGTQIGRPEVREALLRVDNNILKLDTVDAEWISAVDRPRGRYDVRRVIEGMAAFGGKVIIQTMFMAGEWQGKSVDNTGDEYVEPWLAAVKEIAPREVMVYTIDRETPATGLRKATHEQLDAIKARVEAMGIKCQASY
jgi:wyosine [tRNA(Phe)-imidazoG37] synthetase (radical SAM superfamily)